MKSFNRILTLTKRNFKEIIRDPLSLIFMFALPLIMLILFYSIFHKLTPQFEMKYLAPGMVVFGQAFLTLFVAMLIAVDKSSSFIIRLYTTEIKPYEFIISYALSVFPIVLIQSTLILFIGCIIDFSFFNVNLFLVIIMSILTSLIFIAFGILFGSLCNEKSVGGISSIIIMLQSVLSGMWFPLEGLSETFIKVLNILPFRNCTILMQNIMVQLFNFNDFFKPLLIILGYSLLTFIISILVYRKKMKQ